MSTIAERVFSQTNIQPELPQPCETTEAYIARTQGTAMEMRVFYQLADWIRGVCARLTMGMTFAYYLTLTIRSKHGDGWMIRPRESVETWHARLQPAELEICWALYCAIHRCGMYAMPQLHTEWLT